MEDVISWVAQVSKDWTLQTARLTSVCNREAPSLLTFPERANERYPLLTELCSELPCLARVFEQI
jgi:hypothetical protein